MSHCDVYRCEAPVAFILRHAWRTFPRFWILRQRFTSQCDRHADELLRRKQGWRVWRVVAMEAKG